MQIDPFPGLQPHVSVEPLLRGKTLYRIDPLRAIFEIERLEPRRLLTGVSAYTTADSLSEAPGATELSVPAINGQNDSDAATVETASHFTSKYPWAYYKAPVPGTRYREAVATLLTTSLTQSLDQYVVDIDWNGESKSGRLVLQSDGSVAVYVNDGYSSVAGDDIIVNVTIRLANAPADAAPVGSVQSELYSRPVSILPLGLVNGAVTPDSDFSVNLPLQGVPQSYWDFTPASAIEGWSSTFTVELTWLNAGETVATSTATVVRNADGSHTVVGVRPAGVQSDGGTVIITETVDRPAVNGDPAQTYTIQYRGSFTLASVTELPPTKGNSQTPPPVNPPSAESDSNALINSLPPRTQPASLERATGIVSLANTLLSAPDDSLIGEENGDDLASLVS